MIFSKKIRPIYSIICITGQNDINVPDFIPGKMISHTDSCIIISCASESDRSTNIIFGWKQEVENGTTPEFEGYISTGSKVINIYTAEKELIAEKNVPKTRTKIMIWANDTTEPDEIRIGIVKE